MVLLGLVVVGTEAGFLCEKGQAKRAGRCVVGRLSLSALPGCITPVLGSRTI